MKKLKLLVFLIAFSFLSCNQVNDSKNPNLYKNSVNGVMVDNISVGNKNYVELNNILQNLSLKNNINPIETVIDDTSWEIKQKGKQGKKLNIEATINKILNAKEGENVIAVYDEVNPKLYSNNNISPIINIGAYETYLGGEKARIHNITLASKSINNKIIFPNQQFSFNQYVGNTSIERGYLEADVIVNSPTGPKKVDGEGGGICQLATTLFNACEESKLTIIERHPHSKKVDYVPEGRDATISFDNLDFKFLNNKKHPIMIKVEINNSKLKIIILENLSL